MIFIGATLLTLASIAFALQLYRAMGLRIYNEQFLAGMVSLAMALVYLTQGAQRGAPRPQVPWYDWLLAAVSLAIGIHIMVRFPELSEEHDGAAA